jgi:hypothetical protein
MDEALTVGGGTTIGSDTGTAVTEQPGQSTGTENAASETNQTEGGTEQSSTDSGQQQNGGRRKWSIQDEVKELRAQRRELREQLSSFGSVREELAALREELNRRGQTGPAKTPANFWQDPEGALDSRLQSLRDELRDSITSEFHTTREQEFQQAQHRQETASAAEFIRSQQGYDPSDDEDLIEIINEIPNGQSLPPGWKAEYAWMKLQQRRGIGDRSLQKRQAASVQGQPPGVGFGRKTWNKAEFDQAVDMVEKNPHDPKMTELFNELMAAHKEGRVR